MILVDSNVAIDVLDSTEAHHEWSTVQLAKGTASGAFLTHIVVAEIAAHVQSADQLSAMIETLGLPVDAMDNEIAFAAAQAFKAWIRNGGRRGAMLPDLLIGAHAAVRGATVLTRDARRFRTYFPELSLITPESDHD